MTDGGPSIFRSLLEQPPHYICTTVATILALATETLDESATVLDLDLTQTSVRDFMSAALVPSKIK